MKENVLILFLFVLSVFSAQSQEDSIPLRLAAFVNNINTFNQLHPQEKVYLHFDNTGYYLGETIWFKAYTVIADNHQPTTLSRVLYVELLAPNGEILETKKLNIEDGQCHGEFFLKPERYGGFYEVRAYTRLMLNWEESVFSRVFPIFDTPKREGNYSQQIITERNRSQQTLSLRKKGEKRKDLNIHFFPEGGNFITGQASRIAFKLSDHEGRSIDAEGKVCNQQKDVISSFSSVHNGMGYFTFTPEEKGKYTVHILHKNKEYSFEIPDFTGNYTMSVDNLRQDFLFVRLQKQENHTGEIAGISFACRGKIHVFEMVDLISHTEQALKIPKSALPTGINQITAFSSEGEILAERLVFINHHDRNIKNTVKPNKTVYEPFEKIEMEFQWQDSADNPLNTTFSLSVSDAASSMLSAHRSLYSELLLTSDLKGYIENPDYYFESDDMQHQTALDLLMMTQGWRRYSWKQMAGVEPFELKHYIEKGIVIDGQVLSLHRRQKKENIEVTMWMYSDDGFSQKGICTTDADGRFNFLPDDFTGEWRLGLQTKEKGKRKENRIMLNRWFSPPAKLYSFYETTPTADFPALKTLSNEAEIKPIEELPLDSVYSNLLPQVTVKERIKKTKVTAHYEIKTEFDKLRDSGNGYRGNILHFLSDVDPYFSSELRPVKLTLETYDYLYVKKREKGFNIIHSGYDSVDSMVWLYYDITYKGRSATVIIDDRNFFDGEVETWNIDQIKEVSILQEAGIDAPYNSKGASTGTLIIFHTNENKRSYPEPKGIRISSLQGYSNVREFYSPDYSLGALPDEKDYRRTLYWNPNVKTDEQGRAKVVFYNNSSCKQTIVHAETSP